MSFPGRRRKVTNAILVYVLLLLSLQIFLVTVAAEGLLDGDATLAWSATAISVILALIAALFYRYLR
ncbi:hypothetical protein BH23ACT4_BH23ACT4_12320 [soil metagenome]